EDLYAYRSFVFENVQFLEGFSRVTDQPLRRDKLRVHQIHTILFAYVTKWWITDIFHRSQQQWKLSQINLIANLYGHGAKVRRLLKFNFNFCVFNGKS